MTHSPTVSLSGHSCACSKAHKQSSHDGRNENYIRVQWMDFFVAWLIWLKLLPGLPKLEMVIVWYGTMTQENPAISSLLSDYNYQGLFLLD